MCHAFQALFYVHTRNLCSCPDTVILAIWSKAVQPLWKRSYPTETTEDPQHYCHFRGYSNNEDIWIPLTDIPHTSDEHLNCFHRRHTCAPRPPQALLARTPTVTSPTPSASHSLVSPTDLNSIPTVHHRTTVPATARRTSTPPPVHQDLRAHYKPPPQTTTRTGRVARPPRWYDPVHVPKRHAAGFVAAP